MKRQATYSDLGRNSNNNKRFKFGENDGHSNVDDSNPRKVLHFRGLAHEMEASDIVKYAIPFGKIKNMVFVKKKNQALIEMENIEAAISVVSYYKDRPPKFGSNTIYIQFSNHDELDKDLSTQHSNVIKAVQEANNNKSDIPGTLSPVLRVLVDNKIQPITINTLRQIFSKYGEVQKIVTFSKNSVWQALIEMPDSISAQNARTSLNGRNIYDGCCMLRIDMSKQDRLSIKYNNEKSFDFTNPNLPQGSDNDHDDYYDQESSGRGLLGNPMYNESMKVPSLLDSRDLSMMRGNEQSGLGVVNPLAIAQLQATLARELSSFEGKRCDQVAANILHTLTGMSGLGSLQSGAGGYVDYGRSDMHGGCSSGLGRRYEDDRRPGRDRDMSFERGGSRREMDRHDAFNMSSQSTFGGKVIHVSNLNEKMINPDNIFKLFGVYGNVLKVKIIFNKQNSALIEYEEDYQATDAVDNLNHETWFGKAISVVHSKHASIKISKDGSEEPWLTKDFNGTKLHRFRKSNSKNHRHIFPPSSTLHLSNIPPSTTEQDLTDLFNGYGRVHSFKFSPNDRKMAWIKMDSKQSAIEALVGLHDYELAQTSHLRVSFTGYSF